MGFPHRIYYNFVPENANLVLLCRLNAAVCIDGWYQIFLSVYYSAAETANGYTERLQARNDHRRRKRRSGNHP
jgi:hypothetical protein